MHMEARLLVVTTLPGHFRASESLLIVTAEINRMSKHGTLRIFTEGPFTEIPTHLRP